MSPQKAVADRDMTLIERAKAGDQKAYERLLHYYDKAVYHLILRIVRGEEDAEDLMYITFTKAFRNLDKYEPTHSFVTWLFRIASNTAIDFLRKKTISTVSMNTDDKDRRGEQATELQINSEDSNPEEKIIRQQRHHYIQQLVKQLDPDMEKVIRLRFFEEYSYDEIATELHLPLGTVKTQIHRAKKALFQLIKNNGETI
jgi:RNA polymerase sigma factor (sigma-70 family)